MDIPKIESKLEGLNIEIEKVDVDVKNGVYLLVCTWTKVLVAPQSTVVARI
ncbi:MAG: hypothetical protein HQL03_06580 [Nitrospirae bacterium]|nr:hypothetical protein [Nitrospirota bacterium]